MTTNDRIAAIFHRTPNADVRRVAKELGALVSETRKIKSAVAFGTYRWAPAPVAPQPTIAQQWAAYWACVAAMQTPRY